MEVQALLEHNQIKDTSCCQLQRGEMESAHSDYSKVSRLDPVTTVPLERQAMHKFNKK